MAGLIGLSENALVLRVRCVLLRVGRHALAFEL